MPLGCPLPLTVRTFHGVTTLKASYTDLVDIFPTLAVLAGLPTPKGVDGDDVSAVFDDPTTLVKTAAYHQYPACGMNRGVGFNVTRGECNNTPKTQFDYMGYTARCSFLGNYS
jgi:arylsulfatase A-like enzyme